MSGKLAVVGLYGMSAILRVKRIPDIGETVSSKELCFEQGGKGYNQALGALKMGADVYFATAVGEDFYGKEAPRIIAGDGFENFECLTVHGASTAYAAVVSNDEGDNIVIVEHGALGCFTEQMADSLENRIAKCDMLLLQCEMPGESVRRLLEIGRKHGLVNVLNPAPVREYTRDLVSLCDIITPNYKEALQIIGMKDVSIEEAADELLKLGCGAVVITAGDKGAYIKEKDKEGHLQSAQRVKCVDSTGAGDNFNGAMCQQLLEKADLNQAVYVASVSSGLSVTKKGVINAIPTIFEVADYLDSLQRR